MTIPTTYRNADGHTVQQAIGGVQTVDTVPLVDCGTCGSTITLATDGHGELVGVEKDGGRHRHRGEALRDPEAMREAAAMRDEPEDDDG